MKFDSSLISRESLVKIIIVLLVIKLIQVLWQRRHLYYLSYKLEGQFAWPLIGNIPQIGFSGEAFYTTLHTVCETYATPVKAWVGPFFGVILTDPDDINIVMKHTNSLEKSYMYGFTKMWLGDGLLAAPVPIWKKHRKIIAQTFNRSILENYVMVFTKQSTILVDQLQKYSKCNEYFDVTNAISRYSLDSILEAAFGYNIGSQIGAEGTYGDKYIKCTNRILDIFYRRATWIWTLNDRFFKYSSLYKEFEECVSVFNLLTDRIIKENRAIYENQDKNLLKTKSRKKFIDEIFYEVYEANLNWSDSEIKDEISTMIAGGADTTTHSLCFTLLLLAMFPDVQQKVYQEIEMIDELIENDEDRIDVSILDKMAYLNQVIYESLRLFPSAVIIGRYTTGDIKLKTKKLVIPKDVYVTIGISMLHRDKKIWGPNADQFDPENFSKENIKNRHPNAFMAFSSGPRNCVGLKYAELSMKMVFYKILKSYKLETEERFDAIRCIFHGFLNKVGGFKIKIRPRPH